MSRTAALRADVVLAVGLPGMKGIHSLVRVLNELRGIGVVPGRVVPVVNRAPRGGRARSEITATLARLTGDGGPLFVPPVYLPERRVEEPMLDGVRLPATLTSPLTGTFAALVAGAGRGPAPSVHEPELVRPGSIGSWSGQAEEASLG